MTTGLTFTLEAVDSDIADDARPRVSALDLAVVLPTYNERDNIEEVIERLDAALEGLHWEAIFVDDDSPDGTAEQVRRFALHDPRIRLLHRIGRRGLSSACIEGVMATTADFIAVMNADLQHDERILPRMLERLRRDGLDIVVGTRNAEGGSMGGFSAQRVLLSRVGAWFSQRLCHCEVTDPMSGFFLLERRFFIQVAPALQRGGFKILVDIFASSPRPVRSAEIGYCFRKRTCGESKLDLNTAVEFLFLILNKLTGGLIPPQFVMFSMVGAVGLLAHLACLSFFYEKLHLTLWLAQSIATLAAMTENFFLNNLVTYRDRSLRGARLLSGLLSFWLACSFGAWASVIFARSLLSQGTRWYIAGLAGVIVSSVWNYSISSLFTWQMPHKHRGSCR